MDRNNILAMVVAGMGFVWWTVYTFAPPMFSTPESEERRKFAQYCYPATAVIFLIVLHAIWNFNFKP